MAEYKLPLTFLCCPNCGCMETVMRLALPDVERFVSLKQSVIPLEDPRKAVLKVRVLILHSDVCAKCGVEHCTRAEIQDAPIQTARLGSLPKFT